MLDRVPGPHEQSAAQLNLMRCSLIALTFALGACAGQSVALRQCLDYLPPAKYSVGASREFRGDDRIQIARTQLSGDLAAVNYDFLQSNLTAWETGRKSKLIMLRSGPDELIFCAARGSWCGPELVWLGGENQSGRHRQWTVRKYQAGICVTP